MKSEEKDKVKNRLLLMMILILMTEVAADFLRAVIIPSAMVFLFFTGQIIFTQDDIIEWALLFKFLLMSIALG